LSKQGASATELANIVTKAVGGKAGGKGATSLGNGTKADKVDEGIALAIEYLEKFKI
jgi:alanyl-tRNA synthetase